MFIHWWVAAHPLLLFSCWTQLSLDLYQSPTRCSFFLTLFLVCFEIITDSQDMTNPVRRGPRILHPYSPNSPVTSYVTAVWYLYSEFVWFSHAVCHTKGLTTNHGQDASPRPHGDELPAAPRVTLLPYRPSTLATTYLSSVSKMLLFGEYRTNGIVQNVTF